LRCNFVVAAHLKVRLTPQFLRALHLELFTKPFFGDFSVGSSIRTRWEIEKDFSQPLILRTPSFHPG
jgi:hypothetical protein